MDGGEKYIRKSKKNSVDHAFSALRSPDTIVRKLRELELTRKLKFKTFITLTYRKDPAASFRGINTMTIKKLVPQLMSHPKATCLLLCLEDDTHRKHFHLAFDAIVSIKFIRKFWPYGYVQADLIKMHQAVKYYMIKAMHDTSDNYRLYWKDS